MESDLQKKGNEAFKTGDYETARQYYTEAVETRLTFDVNLGCGPPDFSLLFVCLPDFQVSPESAAVFQPLRDAVETGTACPGS